VLEPGFQPLIPIVQQVRHTPIRSVTLDLPAQRVTTADGLVYDVHTNIVYRVEDPIQALTGIDDLRQGVFTLVPLVVHDILRGQTRQTLSDRSSLDHELTVRAQQALARWGLTVEQAGMSTIAPTRTTVRLSQLPARVAERTRLFIEQRASGIATELAAVLTASGPAPLGHSMARYRRHRTRLGGRNLKPARVTVVLPRTGRLWVNDLPVHAAGTQTFDTPELEPEKVYVYTMKVEQVKFGQRVTETRRVEVRAGQAVKVDFTQPASEAPKPQPVVQR
jgi:uncharacterized protein (TIGR03000 family)